MRFGVCVPPEETAAYLDAGIDYVEWPMSRTVGVMDDAEFDDLVELAEGLPVVPEAWNAILPASLKIVGPNADPEGFMAYVTRAFSRAARLGGEVVVFGSGPSRAIPEGWPVDEATNAFQALCERAADVAEATQIELALEPLNRSETNLVNSVAEATAIATSLRHPRLGVLSDLYHVTQENESLEGTAAAGALLLHAHIAEPGERQAPKPGEHEATYVAFLTALHQAGYDGRLSIECRDLTPESAATAIALLRELHAAVTAA